MTQASDLFLRSWAQGIFESYISDQAPYGFDSLVKFDEAEVGRLRETLYDDAEASLIRWDLFKPFQERAFSCLSSVVYPSVLSNRESKIRKYYLRVDCEDAPTLATPTSAAGGSSLSSVDSKVSSPFMRFRNIVTFSRRGGAGVGTPDRNPTSTTSSETPKKVAAENASETSAQDDATAMSSTELSPWRAKPVDSSNTRLPEYWWKYAKPSLDTKTKNCASWTNYNKVTFFLSFV